MHRQFLKNFFAMSKIATLRQICQFTMDHLHTFDSKIPSTVNSHLFHHLDVQSQIIKDMDFSNIIKQFLLLYMVQYVSHSNRHSMIEFSSSSSSS